MLFGGGKENAIKVENPQTLEIWGAGTTANELGLVFSLTVSLCL